MKLFLAGLATETNSFSPIPTGIRAFQDGMLSYGDATSKPRVQANAALHIWKGMAEKEACSVVESLNAWAQPAGPTVRSVFESFRDTILADLTAALPVDIILLSLHGAMIADGYDDCEGELLGQIRELVGPEVIIAGLLDPHAHLTEAMMQAASILVAYKEYPHIDIPERAEDIFGLAIKAAEGTIKPVMRDYDCRMIATYHTSKQPMRGFINRLLELEKKKTILSASLIHGFPWGDTSRTGTRMLVISDDDAHLAATVAEQFGVELFATRHELLPDYRTIEEALYEAKKGPFPVILADVSDNAGGGAPSDATFLLRAIIESGFESVAAGIFWDPVSLGFCREAGENARLNLRLGGKCGNVSGNPIDLEVEVRALKDDIVQFHGELPVQLGNSAWIRVINTPGKIDLVINQQRVQTFHPNAFSGHGIDLTQKELIVVKSSQHFHAGFAPMAGRILYVATPGAINPDFKSIPYKHQNTLYWPRIDNPFS